MRSMTRCLALVSGFAVLGGASPARAAPAPRARVDHGKAADHLQQLSREQVERMTWQADSTAVGAPARKGNQLERSGRVSVTLPGIEGRATRALEVKIKERVGKGSGPAVRLDLSDAAAGQSLSFELSDETGMVQISTGARTTVVRLLPDGGLEVGGTRCADARTAVVQFAAVHPEAFELEPELLTAMFSLSPSPEAGSKQVVATLIDSLQALFVPWLVSLMGDGARLLVEFLQFWFGDLWLAVFCGADPATCSAFVVENVP